MGGARLSRKLLYVGDARVEHLHSLVGIPFRAESSTIVLEGLLRYNVIVGCQVNAASIVGE